MTTERRMPVEPTEEMIAAVVDHFRLVPLLTRPDDYAEFYITIYKAMLAAAPAEPLVSRTYDCGCILCICDDTERCHGCGAKQCGKSDTECDWKQARIRAVLSEQSRSKAS